MKTPTDAGSKSAVINIERSLARMGGDRSLLRDLATFFLEDKDELLSGLETGVTNRDSKLSARCAHSLSGLSANFAADACSTLAKSIEEACIRGDFETAQRLKAGLPGEVARLVEALQRDVLSK